MVGVLFGHIQPEGMEGARGRAREFLESAGFPVKKMDIPIRNLNVGELKRVQLARALATHPRLLLLDELMTGLNPTEIEDAIALVRRIREDGVSILLIEHVMRVIVGVSDRIVVLDHGERIAEGDPAEVMRNPRVVETYLGESFTG